MCKKGKPGSKYSVKEVAATFRLRPKRRLTPPGSKLLTLARNLLFQHPDEFLCGIRPDVFTGTFPHHNRIFRYFFIAYYNQIRHFPHSGIPDLIADFFVLGIQFGLYPL